MSVFTSTGKKKAVTFSFDDGRIQDIRLVELFNQYGVKGTFHLNSGKVDSLKLSEHDGRKLCRYAVQAKDIREVYKGHEIAGHTVDHVWLTKCDDEEIVRQVEEDRLRLSDYAGYEVVGMAYPFGDADERVARLIRERTGVRYARTADFVDSFDVQDDLLRYNPNVYGTAHHDRLMEMGSRFVELETDKPQILYVFGHSYEFDYSADALYRFEDFLKLISGRDDIFYGTNAEVLLP